MPRPTRLGMMDLQSLSEIYQNVCEILYPSKTPRPLLKKSLSVLDESVQNGRSLILLEAPTGYGKSTLSLTIYLAIKLGRMDLAQRVIHVLPMRSIGSHMYKRMSDEYIPKLQSSGLPVNKGDVGLQQMSSPGSPMLCKRFVITTLDTFVSSFYKIPPVEMKMLLTRGSAHYEVPRGCIYSSILVFDEFHLYTGANAFIGGESKMLTAALACIISLLEMGVPVILSTATMPRVIKNIIFDELEKTFGDEISIEKISPSIEDLNFIKRTVKIKTIIEDELFRIVKQNSGDEKRILIVTNTVNNAIEIYNKLKSGNIRAKIIHSKIIESEKELRLKEIESGTCVAVSTQVMEAGVDMSFDIIITEVAPPDSILQRAGRVARYGGEGELYVYPLSESGELIYGRELPNLTYANLEKMSQLSYDLLNIFEGLNTSKLIDRELFSQLRGIDSFPSYSSEVSKQVWRAYCGFIRDSEMIPVVPQLYLAEFINNPGKRNHYMFTIDDLLFTRLFSKGLVKEYITDSMEIKIFTKNFNRSLERECVSELFFRYDILAVVVENYDEEVGLHV